MIDKILKAARKLHAGDVVRVEGTGKDCPEQMVETDVEAFRELVDLVADYFNPGRSDSTCKFCGAPLVWIVTGRGAKAPLDAASIEGLDAGGIHRRIRLSHFATCPKAPGGRR